MLWPQHVCMLAVCKQSCKSIFAIAISQTHKIWSTFNPTVNDIKYLHNQLMTLSIKPNILFKKYSGYKIFSWCGHNLKEEYFCKIGFWYGTMTLSTTTFNTMTLSWTAFGTKAASKKTFSIKILNGVILSVVYVESCIFIVIQNGFWLSVIMLSGVAPLIWTNFDINWVLKAFQSSNALHVSMDSYGANFI